MTAADTATAFMRAWKYRRWKDAFKLTTLTWQSLHVRRDFTGAIVGNPHDELRRRYSQTPQRFKKLHEVVKDEKIVDMAYSVRIQDKSFVMFMRLICEDKAYNASYDGQWGVYPSSFKLISYDAYKKGKDTSHAAA